MAHPPFAGYQSYRLVSIATDDVADPSANCDNAVQIGQTAAAKLTGKSFTEITLHRSDKVKTIGDKNSVSIREKNTVVNPTLFFNGITCVLTSSTDMEQFLTYELAPQTPSLFLDGADVLIVSNALPEAETPKTVIVVGTDTDLLVMLVDLSAPNMDLYML